MLDRVPQADDDRAVTQNPTIGVVMGSTSDWPTMRHAAEVLTQFGIDHEARVISAHRMPDEMFAYAEAARSRGLRAIIAGAGGAAHLPGHARCEDDRSDSRCARSEPSPVRTGLTALDRSDARRDPDRNVRDRRRRRDECGTVRRGHARDRRRRAAPTARTVPSRAPRRRGIVGPAAARMMPRSVPIVPPATIGMLGGGQLGKYALMAANAMGYRTIVVDPDAYAPARIVADEHLVAAYDDAATVDRLATDCSVVTTEFENAPADALGRLARHRCGLRRRPTPSPSPRTGSWRNHSSQTMPLRSDRTWRLPATSTQRRWSGRDSSPIPEPSSRPHSSATTARASAGVSGRGRARCRARRVRRQRLHRRGAPRPAGRSQRRRRPHRAGHGRELVRDRERARRRHPRRVHRAGTGHR